MRVLIVDDDKRRTNLLAEDLVANSFPREQIDFAVSVFEAKRALKAKYYDALVLDVVLPVRVGEPASAENSARLLSELANSSRLNKPEKIIGLTGYIDDIKKFREVFEEYCLSVIEAQANDSRWRAAVVRALTYTASSKFSRNRELSPKKILTVHGIRTFGQWQIRFKEMMASQDDSIECGNYRFGYFSSVAFMIPWVRRRQVAHLQSELARDFSCNEGRCYVIYSHSFGTYLVAEAIRGLIAESGSVPVSLLVLSGSVLPEDYSWSFARDAGIKVVNDCADRDYVLWLSKALILGVGMAGKSGFHCIEGSHVVNRFTSGGHSVYFEGDSYMSTYWIPLVHDHNDPPLFDNRVNSFWIHGVLERIVETVGSIKQWIYACIALWLLWHLASVFVRP